ncbi:DUF6090 family protein [Robiginitalea marina]|uniref:DUF6090 family protein n=1 Tax=Robiginitalea marina TaxID=2954105 RepID=A0ABT1B168_9FLAO|nr:DUF6090 family protein [Robiginitalea marina]MCO5726033.1 DUF6090 family protein [Robiginitalea marina]
MLRFFRSLRQKLLAESRVSRYFAYAVGEIVLVMVGILLALQVNNWNEERKQRQVELKYFNNLKNDLNADLESLDYMLGLAADKVKAAKRVKRNSDLDSIGSLYDFSNDLLALIFVDEFRPNNNTYEEMKSSGNFSSIQNDSLKLKLMNLGKSYIGIEAAQEHMRYDFNVFLEDFEKYVDWGKYFNLGRSDIPKLDLVYDSVYIARHKDVMEKEVRELYKSKVFLNNVFLLEINYTYNIETLKSTKSQIGEIIDILNRELD